MNHRSLPLLGSQKGMWIDECLHSGGLSHNVPICLSIEGSLDIEHLRSAIKKLVAHHDNLRTTFGVEAGEPRQFVAEQIDARMSVVDLCGEQNALGEQIERELRLPLLLTGPLLRSTLFKTGAREWTLLLVLHHLIVDGNTSSFLIEDICTLYEESICNFTSRAVRWGYAELVLSRSTLPTNGAAVEFWKHQIVNAPQAVQFPLSRQPEEGRERAARCIIHDLDDLSIAHLQSFSETCAATPFMVHAALVSTLLHLQTGASDLILGVPISLHDESFVRNRVAGMFVNVMPMRLEIAANDSFKSLLRQVRGRLLRMMSHSGPSMHEVLDELKKGRSVVPDLPFRVCVNFAESMKWKGQAGGCQFALKLVRVATAAFEINVMLVEEDGRYQLWFEFDEAMFEPSYVNVLVDQLLLLLRSVKEHMDVPLGTIELSPIRGEQPQQIACTSERGLHPVHQQIEQQVALTPKSVSVVCSGQTWTYAELDARANAIATRLAERGIGPGKFVTICGKPGPEMLAAILAILKVGGAYVFVEPAVLDEQIRSIIIDSRCTLLLAPKALAPRFAAFAPALLHVDEDVVPTSSASARKTALNMFAVAYCNYRVSGSAKCVRGAEFTHAGLANLVSWYPIHGAGALNGNSVKLGKLSGPEALGLLRIGATIEISETTHAAVSSLPFSNSGDNRNMIGPRTATERRLVSIWKEILQVSELSIFDNFFDHWGNSLLAARLAVRLSEEFRVKTPIRLIFDTTHLAALAERIDELVERAIPETLPPLSRSNRDQIR